MVDRNIDIRCLSVLQTASGRGFAGQPDLNGFLSQSDLGGAVVKQAQIDAAASIQFPKALGSSRDLRWGGFAESAIVAFDADCRVMKCNDGAASEG